MRSVECVAVGEGLGTRSRDGFVAFVRRGHGGHAAGQADRVG